VVTPQLSSGPLGGGNAHKIFSKQEMVNMLNRVRGFFSLDAFAFFLSLLLPIVGYFAPYGPPPKDPNDSILVRSVSPRLVPSAQKDRIAYLTQIAIHYQAAQTEYIVADYNRSIQTKLIFAALFVGLASISLTEDKARSLAGAVAAYLIALVFNFGDAHATDLGYRQIPLQNRINNTVMQLSQITPSDTNWYAFNPASLQVENDGQVPHPLMRKIKIFLRPNVEQSVTYFAPAFMLSLVRIVYRRKRKSAA
jgi:hypothetical protein